MGVAIHTEHKRDTTLINQLAGNTIGTYAGDLRFTGMNATVLPDADHFVIANGKTGEHATLGITSAGTVLASGDTFTMDLINKTIAKAHTLTTPIKPIRLKGMEIFGVLFLHPLQIRSMQTNFSTGQWGDIQRAALTGGQITGNPIFTGAIGMWQNVVIHEDNRIPYSDATDELDSGGTIRFNSLGVPHIARGVFCGAQAACMAFGRAYGADMRMRWFEELLDAGNQLRISSGLIFGMKKTRFNSMDYATITVSSYETL